MASRLAATRSERSAEAYVAASGRRVCERASGYRPCLADRGGQRVNALKAKQRGVAVITAMLIVKIGTIIAVNLMWQATFDIRRAESALAADQGLMYVQGAEAWAADILRQDQVDSP